MFENERAEHYMSEKKEKTVGIIVVAIVAVIAMKFGWLQEYWTRVKPG